MTAAQHSRHKFLRGRRRLVQPPRPLGCIGWCAQRSRLKCNEPATLLHQLAGTFNPAGARTAASDQRTMPSTQHQHPLQQRHPTVTQITRTCTVGFERCRAALSSGPDAHSCATAVNAVTTRCAAPPDTRSGARAPRSILSSNVVPPNAASRSGGERPAHSVSMSTVHGQLNMPLTARVCTDSATRRARRCACRSSSSACTHMLAPSHTAAEASSSSSSSPAARSASGGERSSSTLR